MNCAFLPAPREHSWAWFALQSQFLLPGAGSAGWCSCPCQALLRRCSASPWPHLAWSQLCHQTWAVLAEGSEAAQTSGSGVSHLFNPAEEGNVPAQSRALCPVIERGRAPPLPAGAGSQEGSQDWEWKARISNLEVVINMLICCHLSLKRLLTIACLLRALQNADFFSTESNYILIRFFFFNFQVIANPFLSPIQ